MFRRIRKLAIAYRARLLALVLMPALVLGTLPHTACICSDGHREPACQAAARRLLGAKASACDGCSCCHDGAPTAGRGCCQAAAPAGEQSCGLIAYQGICCHFFAASPTPATTAGKAKVVQQQDVAAFFAADRPSHSAFEGRPNFNWFNRSGPPPLNTVIVFQRLTI